MQVEIDSIFDLEFNTDVNEKSSIYWRGDLLGESSKCKIKPTGAGYPKPLKVSFSFEVEYDKLVDLVKKGELGNTMKIFGDLISKA